MTEIYNMLMVLAILNSDRKRGRPRKSQFVFKTSSEPYLPVLSKPQKQSIIREVVFLSIVLVILFSGIMGSFESSKAPHIMANIIGGYKDLRNQARTSFSR